jgi:ARG and Rhodanese-Phosphatase-superfamily-associated Protein domain
VLNRARGCCATGLVVVEAKSDGLDAEPAKSLKRPRARRRPAKCADVLDPACAELVEVEEALYQHDLASRIGRSGERVGEAVGREVGAAGAAQVEVSRTDELRVVECASPARPRGGRQPARRTSPTDDGQELVGAKQNRVLNVTVLIEAESEVLLPLSCVEEGRWHELRPDCT